MVKNGKQVKWKWSK